MRPIDADQLLDFIRFDERVIAPEEHTAQDIVMMIQTAPTIAPPPNDPLTLDELREMDGEPIWICDPDGSNGMWALVDFEYELCRTAKGGLAIFDIYGKTWLAYRRLCGMCDKAIERRKQ